MPSGTGTQDSTSRCAGPWTGGGCSSWRACRCRRSTSWSRGRCASSRWPRRRASTCAAPRRGRQVRPSAGRRLGRTSSYLGHWRLCSAPNASGTAGSTCLCLCGMRPSWADGASPGRRSMLIGTCKKSWRWPESLSMSLIVRAGSFSAMWGEMQAARRRSWSGAGSEAWGDHAPWCCAVARARRGTGLCPAAGGWNHDNSSTNSNTGWPGRQRRSL